MILEVIRSACGHLARLQRCGLGCGCQCTKLACFGFSAQISYEVVNGLFWLLAPVVEYVSFPGNVFLWVTVGLELIHDQFYLHIITVCVPRESIVHLEGFHPGHV